nr:TMEM175 family protein [Mycobacterium kyorinense]
MSERRISPDRLRLFSDAVFAVLITILVLKLKPPESTTFGALLPLWPTGLSYVVSYLFIAIVWVNHHHLLSYAEVATPRLVWSNFAHLFSVSLIPFTTEWIADSRLAAAPMVLYAAVFVFVDVTYLALCWEAIDRPARVDVPARMRRLLRMRSFITIGVFAAAAVVAVSWPVVAMGMVCLCLAGYLRPDFPISKATPTRGQPMGIAGNQGSSTPDQLPTAPAVVREQPGGDTMRAIILEKFGGLDSLVYADIPKPLPKEGEVVIRVKGFGVNHAEMHMRRGEWAEAAEVSGIECVGVVESCPGREFPVGAKVAALMGGLGRTINGSYAEYTRVRAGNVALIESDLPWSQLAALPETYATAWTCLFRNLKLTTGQTLVIRGATSSFGQAALKMAVAAGARVIATTRSRERFRLLEGLGAERVELERRDLAKHIAEAKQLDAVLDLVGNSTILDSLDMLRRGGTACLAGWLGGLAPIADFNPLLQMASGVYLSFFGSFVFGTPGFPLSDVPLADIARQVADGRLEATPARVFSFHEIHEAHRVMEAGEANGKMVVVVE